MGVFSWLFGACGRSRYDVDEAGNRYRGRPYYDSLPTGGSDLDDFLSIGGTLIVPATNSTHLYYEIRKVYGKLPDDVARYLALQMNSGAAREEMNNDFLISLVKNHSGQGWEGLCFDYTWEWSSRVGGAARSMVPYDLRCDADVKIRQAICRAARNIELGMSRYEDTLRGVPQYRIMQVLAEFEGIRI